VNLNGNTLAVVLDRDLASLAVDSDADLAHVFIVLLVVCGVDQNLVEDLVQTRNVGDVAELHALGRRVVHPHLVCCSLDGTNICVWTFHDVLQMRKLCAC
jgi:hypothetical protein